MDTGLEHTVGLGLTENKTNATVENKNSSALISDSIGKSTKNNTHTIMHPTHEEADRWFGAYKAASSVYLSPRIAAELTQTKGAYFSLLTI